MNDPLRRLKGDDDNGRRSMELLSKASKAATEEMKAGFKYFVVCVLVVLTVFEVLITRNKPWAEHQHLLPEIAQGSS